MCASTQLQRAVNRILSRALMNERQSGERKLKIKLVLRIGKKKERNKN